MSNPVFPIRGVVEGFYGVFYTFPERNDLIRFTGRHGYNLYIYGPKNDRQHRTRWWEPYTDDIMGQFAQTVVTAREAGVTFCYAISPISYSGLSDFERITAKLRAFYDLGVRAFSILMDDIMPSSDQDPNGQGYQHHADLHLDICNRLYDWLHALSPDCTLSMCPIDYHGTAPFSNYLRALGAGLHPAIDIFYTGPQICSPSITATDAQAIADVLGRAPLIWDNYPANDLAMHPEMHIGPVRARAADLGRSARGIVANMMNQAEASKIALLTYADYLHDPQGYEPQRSWERALLEVGGPASFAALHQFAENSLYSCLEPLDAPKLAGLTEAAITALQRGEPIASSPAALALRCYIDSLDESCYFLKNRMANLPLRKDLLPWIEALEHWIWMGKRALHVLELIEQGRPYRQPLRLMEESIQEIRGCNKRIAANALMPLAQYVFERVVLHRQPSPATMDQRSVVWTT